MALDPIPEFKERLRREIVAFAKNHQVSFAGEILGIGASGVCHLNKGNIERFSLEKLIRIAMRADRRVELHIIDETAIANLRKMREGAAKRKAMADARRGGS